MFGDGFCLKQRRKKGEKRKRKTKISRRRQKKGKGGGGRRIPSKYRATNFTGKKGGGGESASSIKERGKKRGEWRPLP